MALGPCVDAYLVGAAGGTRVERLGSSTGQLSEICCGTDSDTAAVAPLVTDHAKKSHPTSIHSVPANEHGFGRACVRKNPHHNNNTEEETKEAQRGAGVGDPSWGEKGERQKKGWKDSASHDWVRRGGTGSEGRWCSNSLKRHLGEKVR